MIETPDDRLLLEYVRSGSAEALGKLIERHIDFVYSSAVRQVRDETLAQDVTQAVFMVLAKKAKSVRGSALSGWLFNTTRYCAANAVRGEIRRRQYERMAAKPEEQMPTESEQTAGLAEELKPMLDEALAHLNSGEREIVLLRYLQGRGFDEVSSILGITREAARKRSARAVDRLRKYFSAKGVTATSAVLAAAIAMVPQKAPAQLVSMVFSAAAGKTAAGVTAASLTTRTIQMMAWAKAKIVAMIIAATAVLGTGGTVVVLQAVAQNTRPQVPPQAATDVPASAARSSSPSTTVSGGIADAAPAARSGAVGRFSNGTTAELLGISLHDDPKKWWGADGRPADMNKVKVPPAMSGMIFNGFKGRRFSTRWRIQPWPKNNASINFRLPKLKTATMWTWWPQDGLLQLDAIMPAGVKSADIAMGLAAGAWTTVLDVENPTLGSDDAAAMGKGQIPAYRVSPATDTAAGATVHVTVTTKIMDGLQSPQFQLIAHTPHGDVVGEMRTIRADVNNKSDDLTIVIPKTMVADLAAVEFQTRPYEWVEFRNVSLVGGQHTQFEIAPPDKK